MDRSKLNREIWQEMAKSQAIAEQLSGTLGRALRTQSAQSRASSTATTLTEVEAEVAEANEQLSAIEVRGAGLEQRARRAAVRSQVAEFRSLEREREALRDVGDQVRADLAELQALADELRGASG